MSVRGFGGKSSDSDGGTTKEQRNEAFAVRWWQLLAE